MSYNVLLNLFLYYLIVGFSRLMSSVEKNS